MDRPIANARRSGLLRLLLPVTLVMVLSLCLSSVILYLSASASAEADARQYGQSLGRSTAILIQPLLLADDRISLNYLFNELEAQPRVSGLRLLDAQGLPVAVAGAQQGLAQTLELARGNEVLGELTLWIDQESSWSVLRQLLMETGALALLSLLGVLITLWFSLRPSRAKPSPTQEEFSQVAARVGVPEPEVEDPDALPTLQPLGADTQRSSAPPQAPSPRSSPEANPETDAQIADVTNLAPQVASWLRETPTAPEAPMTAASQADTANSPSPPETPQRQPAPEVSSPDRDDNSDLVDLLRPARERDLMPPFTPSSYSEEESDEAIAPELEPVELEENNAPESRPEHPPTGVPPLDERTEEQLGLYTLEQELELMLSAEEAGYLFLIDASSARSDNLEEEERARLMRPYRTLANSVAHIYGGRVEPTAEGDLQLFFDAPSADDSHGINALCSAMLFAYLYRHYNQHRVRQFKPVINLHLALVRGHHEKLERLLEEARFLTRTTESNELISHTALTEAADLKDTLLEGADIRREDEDKVLIIRIAKSYQELLEKQARHLLTKLQKREQGHS